MHGLFIFSRRINFELVFLNEDEHIEGGGRGGVTHKTCQAAVVLGYGDFFDTNELPTANSFAVDDVCILLNCSSFGIVLAYGKANGACNCFVLSHDKSSKIIKMFCI